MLEENGAYVIPDGTTNTIPLSQTGSNVYGASSLATGTLSGMFVTAINENPMLDSLPLADAVNLIETAFKETATKLTTEDLKYSYQSFFLPTHGIPNYNMAKIFIDKYLELKTCSELSHQELLSKVKDFYVSGLPIELLNCSGNADPDTHGMCQIEVVPGYFYLDVTLQYCYSRLARYNAPEITNWNVYDTWSRINPPYEYPQWLLVGDDQNGNSVFYFTWDD